VLTSLPLKSKIAYGGQRRLVRTTRQTSASVLQQSLVQEMIVLGFHGEIYDCVFTPEASATILVLPSARWHGYFSQTHPANTRPVVR
jgi:hypothetical protein